MKFFLLTLVACVSATLNTQMTDAFSAFMSKYEKSYDTVEEYAKRLTIFADNMDDVARRNAEHVLINGEAVFGVTKFSDLTPEEFKTFYLGYKPSNITKERVILSGPVANDVDWVSKGAVTPVKDQGRCGSCWAFSATAAIESYAQLAGKGLKVLSAQQINSCDKRDGGCNGGNTETAYEYVKGAGGIETESDYPYTSGGGSTGSCKFNSGRIAITINGYHSVGRGESNLKQALNEGPASVCLAASSWQSYRGGILSKCDNQVDHCVQTTGYSGSSYWKIRNSWGTGWGESGFIRLAQGSDLCKVSDDTTYPTY
jgi:cathepsin F